MDFLQLCQFSFLHHGYKTELFFFHQNCLEQRTSDQMALVPTRWLFKQKFQNLLRDSCTFSRQVYGRDIRSFAVNIIYSLIGDIDSKSFKWPCTFPKQYVFNLWTEEFMLSWKDIWFLCVHGKHVTPKGNRKHSREKGTKERSVVSLYQPVKSEADLNAKELVDQLNFTLGNGSWLSISMVTCTKYWKNHLNAQN